MLPSILQCTRQHHGKVGSSRKCQPLIKSLVYRIEATSGHNWSDLQQAEPQDSAGRPQALHQDEVKTQGGWNHRFKGLSWGF